MSDQFIIVDHFLPEGKKIDVTQKLFNYEKSQVIQVDPNWPMRFERGFPHKYRMKHSFVGTYLPSLEMRVQLNDSSANSTLIDTGSFVQGRLPSKPLVLDFSLQREIEVDYETSKVFSFSRENKTREYLEKSQRIYHSDPLHIQETSSSSVLYTLFSFDFN